MTTILDTRSSRTMTITEDLSIMFDPVQCKDGIYKSRDPLSVDKVVSLIASRSELKGVPLHINGCCPLVDLETARRLAEIANMNSHAIPQQDIPTETDWAICVWWPNELTKEDYCRFLLQIEH